MNISRIVLVLIHPLCVFSLTAWEDIREITGEVEYLAALSSYIQDSDRKTLQQTILQIGEVEEGMSFGVRTNTTISLILEVLYQDDSSSSDPFFVQNWDIIEESVKWSFLNLKKQNDYLGFKQFILDNQELSYSWEMILNITLEDDPQFVADNFERIPNEEVRLILANRVFIALLALNRSEAMNFAQKHRVYISKASIIDAMSKHADTTDEEIYRLLTSESDGLPSEELTNIAYNLSFTRPKLGIRLSSTFEDELRQDLIENSILHLKVLSSAQAQAFLETQSIEPQFSLQTLKKLIFYWAYEDSDAALAWASAIEEKHVREALILRINTTIGTKNINKAIAMIDNYPASSLRDRIVANIAILISKKDFKTALTWTNSLPEGREKSAALEELVNVVAARKPEDILEISNLMANTYSSGKFKNSVFSNWIFTDVEGAAKWVYGGNHHESLLSKNENLAEAMATHAPSVAIDFLRSQDLPDSIREKILEKFIAKNAHLPDVMKLLYISLDELNLGPIVDEHDIRELAKEDLLGAHHLLKISGDNGGWSIEQFYQSWALKNPVELADALKKRIIDPVEFPDSVYRGIAEAWARKDFNKAADWVESLTEYQPRRHADLGIALVLGETDPGEAVKYLDSIKIQSHRDQYSHRPTYSRILKNWAYYDPASAYEALAKTSLSRQTKQLIFEEIERHIRIN